MNGQGFAAGVFGSFNYFGVYQGDDYAILTPATPTPTPTPTPAIGNPAGGAFDAGGGGYGQWYNTAFDTSPRSDRRVERHTEIGKLLDSLVFADDIRADADPVVAAPIIHSAVAEITAYRHKIQDEVAAIALVETQYLAYSALLQRTAEEAKRAFVASVIETAARERQRRQRVMHDDEDILMLAEMVLS